MLVMEKSHMVVIEAASGAELEDRYNKAMDELTDVGITIEERMISIEKMSAIILWKKKVKVAECLKDEFELQGIFPRCYDCPHYDGAGWCERLTRNSEPLRDDTEICKFRWYELEKEMGRGWIDVKKSESGNVPEKRDERKAC